MSRTSNPDPEPCVLLVEDEVGTQDALSTLLELDGWKVIQAYDGAEALVRLKENQPDVIVTDYMMPNVDGLVMVERIRRDPELAHIPVVLVSAISVAKERRHEVQAFLRKPVDLTALREVLAALGRGRRNCR